MKCKKCNNDMEMLDFGEDFEYLLCTGIDCQMTLTIQEDGEDVWEDRE